MNTRQRMLESNENLSWCRPYTTKNECVKVVVNEGEVIDIRINGCAYPLYDNNGRNQTYVNAALRYAVSVVSQYYDVSETEGNDLEILLNHMRELPCRRCPAFEYCDAMDV